MDEIEIINTVAKAKMPPVWEPYLYQCHGIVGGTIVTGDVPIGVVARGAFAGYPKFGPRRNGTSCFVSDEECKEANRWLGGNEECW